MGCRGGNWCEFPLPFTMDDALQMAAGQAFCILQSKGREIFGMLFPGAFQGALSNKGFLCGNGQSVPRESNHFAEAGPSGGPGGEEGFSSSFAT